MGWNTVYCLGRNDVRHRHFNFNWDNWIVLTQYYRGRICPGIGNSNHIPLDASHSLVLSCPWEFIHSLSKLQNLILESLETSNFPILNGCPEMDPLLLLSPLLRPPLGQLLKTKKKEKDRVVSLYSRLYYVKKHFNIEEQWLTALSSHLSPSDSL